MFGVTRTSALIGPEQQPEVFNAAESQYKEQLEQVKTTLFDVSNPCLLSRICEKLNQFIEAAIDPTVPADLADRFCDASFPIKLQAILKRLANVICDFCCEHPFKLEQRIEIVREAIRELSTELAQSNQPKLQTYNRWKDFQLLFSLPGMMALPNDEINKLIDCIDQKDSEILKKRMTDLSAQNKLDLVELGKSLKASGYNYSWKTLCAELIKNQPFESEGVFTHWNQPDPFFTNKKLQIDSPQGHVFMGTIDQSSKKTEVRKFKLEDRTRVRDYSPPLPVCCANEARW